MKEINQFKYLNLGGLYPERGRDHGLYIYEWYFEEKGDHLRTGKVTSSTCVMSENQSEKVEAVSIESRSDRLHFPLFVGDGAGESWSKAVLKKGPRI